MRGEIVAFPTETYYGLGAAALHAGAIDRLVALKGRETGRPFPVLVADRAMLDRIARVPEEAEELLRRYWPGPLTVALPAMPGLPAPLVSDTGEVGARISSHPLAQQLVARLGAPITATSANRAGERPACNASEVGAGLPGVSVLDGGPTPGGAPSTVVRFERGRLIVLRQGALRVSWPR